MQDNGKVYKLLNEGNQFNYKLKKTYGDGNCLYRAIASSITTQELAFEVETARAIALRAQLSEFIKANSSLTYEEHNCTLAEFVVRVEGCKDFDSYLFGLETDTYGGAFEIHMMSYMLNFSYRIFKETSADQIEEIDSDSKVAPLCTVNLLHTLVDGAELLNHYDRLKRIYEKGHKKGKSKSSRSSVSSSVSGFGSFPAEMSSSSSSSESNDDSGEESKGDSVDEMQDFLDKLLQCDMSGLDSLMAEFETEDVKGAFAELGDDLTTEMMDMLGRPKIDAENKLPPSRNYKQNGSTISEVRSPVARSFVKQFIKGDLHLVSVGDLAFITDGVARVLVGVSKEDGLSFALRKLNPFEVASEINESSNTKGTGLGFSSFIHSTAISAISGDGDILEPHEGFDLIKSGVSVEVTGWNYSTRKTRATLCLNKYSILSACWDCNEEELDLITLSMKEDDGDATMFFGTGMDHEESPYTSVVRKQLAEIQKMSMSNYLNLSNMFKSWHSREPYAKVTMRPTVIDPSRLLAALESTGKPRGGRLRYPAPMRVLPGSDDWPRDFDRINYNILPQLSDSDMGSSTYRNMDVSDDVESMMMSPCEHEIPDSFEEFSATNYWMHRSLSRYSIYCSMWVESELIPKIAGYSGNFFSEHSNTGICWRRTSSGSLTWFCAYFSFNKQPSSCGEWRIGDPDRGIWLGPTFKVSVNDINHAKIMPHRAISMVAAIIPYTRDRERVDVVTKVLLACSMSKSSSWQTSVLAKSFRFLVLNMISRTGDPQSQIDSIASSMNKPLPSADYILVRCVLKSINRFNERSQDTPLLGLPMRFINLEKDFALATMWHMRKIRDNFLTVKKLVRAAEKELESRNEELVYQDLILANLKAVNAGNFTQLDFDMILEYRPAFPHFNALLFAGMAYIAANGTDFGTSQKSASVRISTLISDKRCVSTTFRSLGQIDGMEFKQLRVADAMARYLSSHGDPPSIFHLVRRMMKAPSEPLVNFNVEKGAKSGRREIPQMNQNNRVQQMFEEKNLSIYVDQEQDDSMTDPLKFVKFANDSSSILRAGGSISSEDKSSFCHNQHPEFLGIAIYMVARMVGSTGMITSAAILLCDTVRYSILPDEIDPSLMDSRIVVGTARGIQGKKFTKHLIVKNIKNFQQGQRAYGGAVLNTVFTKAFDRVQKESSEMILQSTVRTTSDDLSRGVVVDPHTEFDEDVLEEDYFAQPIKLNNACMMENSDDKFMVSRLIGEFNNVTVGPNGLMNSSLTNSILSIQPLNGDNPMDDLITLTSNSKMSLPWGTSLDVIRTCYYSYFAQFQQKWLFSTDQMSYFLEMGILPKTDEEIIEGFGIRSNEMRLRIASMFRPDQVADVLSGEVQVMNALRSFRVRDSKVKKIRGVNYISRSIGIMKVFRRISASRRVRGRMAAGIARPLPVAKRIAVRDGFMSLVSTPHNLQCDDSYLIADLLSPPPKVKIVPMYPQMRHLLPFKMGDSRKHSDLPNLNKVRVKRLTGMVLTDPLTQEETAMSNLDQEEFEKAEFRVETKEKSEGASWMSPAGASLFRFHNDKMFKVPMAFTYKVDIGMENWRSKPVVILGVEYIDFEPTFINGYTVKRAISSNYHLPFGTAWRGSEKFAFVEGPSGNVTKLTVRDTSSKQVVLSHPNLRRKVLLDNVKFKNPITVDMVNTLMQPWYNNTMAGDPNALLNYGNYMNTNSKSVKRMREHLFEMAGSREPGWIQDRLREWPYHFEDSNVVKAKTINVLRGSKYVCNLRLDFSKLEDGHQTVDVNKNPPEVLRGFLADVEEEAIF